MDKIVGLTPLYDGDLKSLWLLDYYMEMLNDFKINYVILPFHREKEAIFALVDQLDGFIFSGGQDIHPSIYGEENRHCKEFAPKRDFLETTLMEALLEKDIPVLGICRGFQLMNGVMGGKLYQDLKEEFKDLKDNHEMEKPYTNFAHWVNTTHDDFKQMVGTSRFQVNSLHHQGIRELADDLVEICRSDDGLIEGAYDPRKKFFLGVQWHPEYAYQKSEANVQLMKAFKNAL
ncbi:MAG: gamma-glutamyl-gamma-aminobutyrate hydrolase family protein [Tissierellia bacterium]|nr:gamma-glutamyl-gamma-aminobutyrate hydrolase family protein [Tissierellia bacterium]